MAAGTCHYCGCTEARACAGGCRWTDAARTLCSHCAETERIAEASLTILQGTLTRTQPNLRGLNVTWSELTAHERQLLVMAHRGLVEALREHLVEDLGADAVASHIEWLAIADFLEQHCPHELSEDEPIAETVARLLTPHVGSRIVVP